MDRLEELKRQAKREHVPVMMDDGMEFLLAYIREHPAVMKILECGTAVGLSAMKMASVRTNITIDTLEVDPVMYEQALSNIREAGLADRVFVHLTDASLFATEKYFDLFFIDAAKSQYRMYVEHFWKNSYVGSVFVFDNLNFHGIVDHPEYSENRSTLQMTRKIKKFRDAMQKDERFEVEWHPQIGDGVMLAKRIR